ncbi:tyrosine-type recombinase/integrase [Evansella clarkii]|uniref:tyrosine-type recombinase/integrase n=1 Tax=Evansella clarkii TaxID=79879 RepID=UPI000B453132|nr:site-specific integrase [Evansella clarkii]
MTKKKDIYSVESELTSILNNIVKKAQMKGNAPNTIDEALRLLINQMIGSGLRERTIRDYKINITHFIKQTKIHRLEEINADTIYRWLAEMQVSNQTKLTRLKCLKAFLNRCFDNGWLSTRFWTSIKIKVDKKTKPGTNESDILKLLLNLDLSSFVEFRDATAILLLYQTGIRVGTLGNLKESHLDLDRSKLILDGEIMKNHEVLILPFDDDLKQFFKVLIKQNNHIREEYNKTNNYLFITKFGDKVSNDINNNIKRRLHYYSKKYSIANINPHAIRRGFARSLLDQGADITLISKALGHSDIQVTTRYLHIDKEEVAERLRNYL